MIWIYNATIKIYFAWEIASPWFQINYPKCKNIRLSAYDSKSHSRFFKPQFQTSPNWSKAYWASLRATFVIRSSRVLSLLYIKAQLGFPAALSAVRTQTREGESIIRGRSIFTVPITFHEQIMLEWSLICLRYYRVDRMFMIISYSTVLWIFAISLRSESYDFKLFL